MAVVLGPASPPALFQRVFVSGPKATSSMSISLSPLDAVPSRE
jgi:hypothetical protein